ncbi:AraC family transcriptional regulator [Paenibacillus alkaliterrae]|uniref:helix-turn-helix transcriptional regulator n=1 Tax=Paenibacillus alkaliterrae TaxID=320909 RepID=UPI001F3B2B01|nr:AraC family transcriptional regulator [Paenibacillus alkaliterrae]MCF2938024.1 AraC family transcriptional regulator [Paenibacillus alkaliterrae]
MNPGAFAFRYTESIPYMLLDSIGWQSTNSEKYGNDGQTRTDNGHVIFQYTLSGEGKLDLDGRTYPLRAGTAFLVKIPSSHRYYYTHEAGEPWEFIWLNAKGEDALRMWDRILDRSGHILTLQPKSLPIARFWELYRAISEDRESESSALSSLLYNFLLSMLAPDVASAPDLESHPLVRKAESFMKENYALNLSLEDIASHCGISRAYLCRLFQKQELISPLEFLRRRRIEAAVTMLRSTAVSVQEVGMLCGFDSPSYFGKVFRRYLGLSPREYRSRKMDYPFNTVFLE